MPDVEFDLIYLRTFDWEVSSHTLYQHYLNLLPSTNHF